MNGRQLVEEALRQRPDLRVIIASGYSTEKEMGTGLEGRSAGSPSHLTRRIFKRASGIKPFDLAQLRKALGV